MCVGSFAQSCLTLCDPVDCSPSGSSVHGIFGQEYWNGLPFLAPADLPYLEIQPTFLESPALAGRCFIYHCASWQGPLLSVGSPAGIVPAGGAVLIPTDTLHKANTIQNVKYEPGK